MPKAIESVLTKNYFSKTDIYKGRLTAMGVCEIVTNVLSTGYLSNELEEQLRLLPKNNLEDVRAFLILQRATIASQNTLQCQVQQALTN